MVMVANLFKSMSLLCKYVFLVNSLKIYIFNI